MPRDPWYGQVEPTVSAAPPIRPAGETPVLPSANPLRPGDVSRGQTPHLTIGAVRQELAAPVAPVTPVGLKRTHNPHGGRLSEEDLETRRALVRYIAADPVKQQWLRDYGAALLRSAAAELLMAAHGPAVRVVEVRAAEHERGETALW